MQTTSQILMIRPVNFAFNQQTAETNAFMEQPDSGQLVQPKALREFDAFVELLDNNGVDVLLVEDTDDPHTPDSIFPNNWFSSDSEGCIYLYPMEARNRRYERKKHVLAAVRKKFEVSKITDFSYLEEQGKFLEGTGSMVLDHENKTIYACLSSRTHPEALAEFCKQTQFQPITFHASDKNHLPVYHTNVLMCVGDRFAVICTESLIYPEERSKILEILSLTDKEIIEINFDQLLHFAGNMIQLNNKTGDNLIVMSEQAFKSLSSTQIKRLDKYGRILFSPLYTIETVGGGSARCMIAEIFLRKKQS